MCARLQVPDVPYRYGKKWGDVPDHVTGVPAEQSRSGVAPKDVVGSVEERDFGVCVYRGQRAFLPHVSTRTCECTGVRVFAARHVRGTGR